MCDVYQQPRIYPGDILIDETYLQKRVRFVFFIYPQYHLYKEEL